MIESRLPFRYNGIIKREFLRRYWYVLFEWQL